jgi:hypothetical protein
MRQIFCAAIVLACAVGVLSCTGTGVTWQVATSGTDGNNELVSLVLQTSGSYQMYAKSQAISDSSSCCTSNFTGTWATVSALAITLNMVDCSLAGSACAAQSCPQSQGTMAGTFTANCSLLMITIPGVPGDMIMMAGTAQSQCVSVSTWIAQHRYLVLGCGIGVFVFVVGCLVAGIYITCCRAKVSPGPRYEPIIEKRMPPTS